MGVKEGDPSSTATMPGPGQSSTQDQTSGLAPFLAAAATGLGALGWVTAVGGAIVWIHVSQAGLPPAQAVAKVPPTVLIAHGAEFLVIAVLASLVTIGFLFLFDEVMELRAGASQATKLELVRRRLEQKREAHRRAAAEMENRARDVRRRRQRVEAARLELVRHEAEGESDPEELKTDREHVHKLQKLLAEAEKAESTTQAAAESSQRDLSSAEAKYRSEASLTGLAGLRIIGTGVALGLATLLLATLADFNGAALVDWGGDDFPLLGWVTAVAMAVLVGVVGAFLFLRTASFPILALFSFLTVPLVFAIATYFRANDVPQVEPVALLRADGTPFVGFFLAETGERVFVGTFREEVARRAEGAVDTVPARLLSLPAADVSNLTVGPRLTLDAEDADEPDDPSEPRTAREWAAEAALLLCENAAAARERAQARIDAGEGSVDESLPLTCGENQLDELNQLALTEGDAIDPAGRE